MDTHQLREKIGEKLGVPVDETESYIAYHHVDDEDSDVDPNFSIIWTSKKLLSRIGDELNQDDSRYGYGFYVFHFFFTYSFASQVNLAGISIFSLWKIMTNMKILCHPRNYCLSWEYQGLGDLLQFCERDCHSKVNCAHNVCLGCLCLFKIYLKI